MSELATSQSGAQEEDSRQSEVEVEVVETRATHAERHTEAGEGQAEAAERRADVKDTAQPLHPVNSMEAADRAGHEAEWAVTASERSQQTGSEPVQEHEDDPNQECYDLPRGHGPGL